MSARAGGFGTSLRDTHAPGGLRAMLPRLGVAAMIAVLVAPLCPSGETARAAARAAAGTISTPDQPVTGFLPALGNTASTARPLERLWTTLEMRARERSGTDGDGDGLRDATETVLGLDPGRADTDLDTISDRTELWLGTNPREPDSNGDGLTDNAELEGTPAAILQEIDGQSSSAEAVNDLGVVVGARVTDEGAWEAISWDGLTPTVLPAAISSAYDINNHGQVTGKTASGDAFVWSTSAGMVTLGLVDGHGMAINDAGTVVGAGMTDPAAMPRAFRWQAGTLTFLGTLGGERSSAADISSTGVVVGDAQTKDGATHAFRWSTGPLTDLGTLGGAVSQAVAVNAAGQVAGTSQTASGDSHAFRWADGTLTDLGTLGGPSSFAEGMDAEGRVVGQSETAAGDYHAFLWDDGVMTDLGTTGGPMSGATAINADGLIVGQVEEADGTRRAAMFGALAISPERIAAARSSDDNDGDGVHDATDNSPFTTLPADDEVTLEITTGGKATYVDLQVVPETPDGAADRSALAMAQLDWRDDDQAGSMQDRNASKDDVTLVPYLELEVPDRSLLESDADITADPLNLQTSDLERYGIMLPTDPEDAMTDRARILELPDVAHDGSIDYLRVVADRLVPFGDVTALVAGGSHTCARTTDGAMWCWGNNWEGQLGTGAPGVFHAVGADGTAWDAVWSNIQSDDWDHLAGPGYMRPTGMGTPATEPYPVGRVADLASNVTGMDAGGGHGCATAGDPPLLYCWGRDNFGQGGPYRLEPRQAAGSASWPVTAVATGGNHTCAVDGALDGATRRVICRGLNSSGQLGNGSLSTSGNWVLAGSVDSWEPIGSSDDWEIVRRGLKVDPTVTSPTGAVGPVVVAGDAHTCAIVNVAWDAAAPSVYPTPGRRVACWGANGHLESSGTGMDPRPTVTIPTTVFNLAFAMASTPAMPELYPVALAAGARHTCAISGYGQLACWGGDDHRQVTGFTDFDVPAGQTVTGVAAGDGHTCALTSAGRAWCWGLNDHGQLGTGVTGGDNLLPTEVSVPGEPGLVFMSITAGANHTCALADSGRAWCWGANDRGQLGIGSTGDPVPTPTLVGTRRIVDLVGYGYDPDATGPASATSWLPPIEESHIAASDPALPTWAAENWPSFDGGTQPERAIAADINGNGVADEVFLYWYDPATGLLHYRLGIPDGHGSGWWTDPETGGALAPGAEGNVITLVNVDGQPGLDIVHLAVDDLDLHSFRVRVGGGVSFTSGPIVTAWEAPVVQRGASVRNLLYVPLAPITDQATAVHGYKGRLLLPASLPVGELTATVRMVWMVQGKSDDPHLTGIEDLEGTTIGDPGVFTPLAKYRDRFALTGLTVTEHARIGSGVFTPAHAIDPTTGTADEDDRAARFTQAGLVLEKRWLKNLGQPADDELWLDELPSNADFAAIPLAKRTMTYPHEDAAIIGTSGLVSDVLEEAAAGPAVPVLFALEREFRSVSLDDGQFVTAADGVVAVGLQSAPLVTLKTFETNAYDTTGAQPEPLGAGFVDWVHSWGFEEDTSLGLASLFIAWDVGETVVAGASEAYFAEDGFPDAEAEDALVQAVYDGLDDDQLGWQAFKVIATMADKVNLLSAPFQARVSSVWDWTLDSDGQWKMFKGTSDGIDSGRVSRLVRQTNGLALTKATIQHTTEWIEKGMLGLEIALAGTSFFVTWLAYGGMYGLANAMAELVIDLVTTLAEWMLGAALASAMTASLGAGPAGWVAAAIVLVLAAGLLALEKWTNLKWYSWVKGGLVDYFFEGYDVLHFGTALRNLRPEIQDRDGNGLDTGDYIGMAGDAYVGIFPVGEIDPDFFNVSPTRTTLYDLFWSWMGAGLRATTGVPVPGAENPNPNDPSKWVRDEQVSGGFYVEAPPHQVGAGWHYAEDPGRAAVVAGVVPSAPDHDFAITYQVVSKASMTGVSCARIGGCEHSFERGSTVNYSGDSGSAVHYDVLPGSLDAFLGWSTVVTRLDNDGDGIADATDPYDLEPDHDQDGVPDGYEVQELGTPATDDDADDDGLSDGKELELGTDPKLADSDGDTLPDGTEVHGWGITATIGGRLVTARVTSNPMALDTDAGTNPSMPDGLDDLAEFQEGLNPRSWDTDGNGIADGRDIDADGVSGTVEALAPNGGDANADGTPDAAQPGVASLPNAMTGTYVTVAAPSGTEIEAVRAIEPATLPAKVSLPLGLVSFTLDVANPGEAAVVTLYAPYDKSLKGYWKFGPTTGDTTAHWYAFAFDGTTGAQVAGPVTLPDGRKVSVVTLHLVDGGRGDADLVADGTITDPGGVGFVINTPPVATDDIATTTEDSPVTIDVLANDEDVDGDNLVVASFDAGGAEGSVTRDEGRLAYDPDGQFEWLGAGGSVEESFTYVVDDGSGGTAPATVRVTVTGMDDPPAVAVDPAAAVDYSDSLTPDVVVSATDVDTPGDGLVATATGLPAGMTLAVGATSEGAVLPGSRTWTVAGATTAAPGDHLVQVIVTDASSQVGTASLVIKVRKEWAEAAYTGDMLAFATGGSSTADVSLRATVRDGSAVVGAADAEPGDVRDSTVTFMEGAAVLCGPLPVGLIGTAVTSGTVSCTVPLGLGAHAVSVVVGGSYIGTSDGVIEVAEPEGSFVTGGGWLAIGTSGGSRKADAASRLNLGFNVTLGRKMDNLRGHVVAQYRAGGRTYQLRSTAIDSLGIAYRTPTGASCQGPVAAGCWGLVTFRSKANLVNVTDPLAPVSLAGNLVLQVTLTDRGEPGSADSLGITAWDGPTLVLASEWTGAKTLETVLGGGNLVVH